MRFLLDANLPRSASSLLQRLGHEAIDVRDIGMRHSHDELIAAYARENQCVMVTRDFDFADIRNYPPVQYEGIVVLEMPDDATADQVLGVLETFVSRPDWMEQLRGKLAIVEGWRVRFRV
jgi:predicted nuclease of predicted toxin-antitoxin system